MKLRKSRAKSQNKKKMEGLKFQFWINDHLLQTGSTSDGHFRPSLQSKPYQKSNSTLAIPIDNETHKQKFLLLTLTWIHTKGENSKRQNRKRCHTKFPQDQHYSFYHDKKNQFFMFWQNIEPAVYWFSLHSKMQTNRFSIRIFTQAFHRTD